MSFPDSSPKLGDSDNNLLFKIAQLLSEGAGGGGAEGPQGPQGPAGADGAVGPQGPSASSNPLAVYAAGTGHPILSSGSELVSFSVTSPILTINSPGTYRLRARFKVDYEAATVSSANNLYFSLFRSNNGLFGIPNSETVIIARLGTTLTETFLVIELPETFYTTALSTDTIRLLAISDIDPDAGVIRITEASVTAVRIG